MKGTRIETDEESGSADTTLDGSHSPASSQGSACSLHYYSSGCCDGGGSWADQCLSKDGGNLASVEEENASHRTTEENDGEKEKPQTPLAFVRQGKQESMEESWERTGEQEDPNKATPATGILSPANSQDNVIVHVMEAKLRSLD